jgi:hypothetical protein
VSDPAISIDFETFYDDSKKQQYSVRTMIAEQYCNDPRFDAYMLSVCDGSKVWSGHPSKFNWNALDGRTVVSHNKYFDLNVWEALHRRGKCPKPAYKEFFCTADMSSYLCNRRALFDAMEYLMHEKIDKSARAEAKGLRWEVFSPDAQKKMLEYAKQDAWNCWRLWNEHSPRWPALERRLSNITIAQGMRGVQIDQTLLIEYIVKVHDMLQATEQVIPWIAEAEDESWDDFSNKPTSSKCIAEQCRRAGIPSQPIKADDAEAYESWATTYAPTNPWINAVSCYRALNKFYKALMLIKERLRTDGTLPFALKYCGAHTARWSGDARINFQNFRKNPILCRRDGLMEIDPLIVAAALDQHDETGTWPEWVKFAVDFRALIIPRPGYKMLVSDLSQIEPRVLAWLAGDWTWLNLVKQGWNPYEAHAKVAYGWEGKALKSTDPTLYKLSKAARLGLGYGCGWEKFIVMSKTLAALDICANDPKTVLELDPVSGEDVEVSGYGQLSKKTVAEFRANNPSITCMWKKLDDAFRRSVGEDFTMKLPSGRTMRYENVRQAVRSVPDDRNPGKRRKKYVFTAGIGGIPKEFYGGKLTENITQAVARDVFAEHIDLLDRAGMRNLFSVHDEAVLEVKSDVTVADVQEIMSTCPAWLPGCPITAEAVETERYFK